MVRGEPTAGLVDGGAATLGSTYEVTGTEMYRTASGGSNTVMVIEPFDTAKAKRLIEEADQAVKP